MGKYTWLNDDDAGPSLPDDASISCPSCGRTFRFDEQGGDVLTGTVRAMGTVGLSFARLFTNPMHIPEQVSLPGAKAHVECPGCSTRLNMCPSPACETWNIVAFIDSNSAATCRSCKRKFVGVAI